MSADDVSLHLGEMVPASKITKAYRDGDLVGTKVGRSVFFTETDVDAWLYACRTPRRASGGATSRSRAMHRSRKSA